MDYENCGAMFLWMQTVFGLVVSLQVSFRSSQNFLYVRRKTQQNFLPIFVFGEAEDTKIWWNPQVQPRTRSLAQSDCGSHCKQKEWLKELEDTSPANEARGQNTTSASRM